TSTKPRLVMVTKPRTAARRVSMPLLRRVQRLGQLALQAVVAGAIPETRTGDAGGPVPADDAAVLVLPGDFVDEQILGDDHVALQAHHLGDVGDAAAAVAQARGLDDDVDRADDHLADGLRG